ncbi:hypothetical protein RIE95_09690 [Acidithiobacillus thiooxidans]|uniref:hypothetical protein n=1 Tax=Acidithiobacillus TaxID=119977 RepID=UPI0002624CE4|nr:MULTISPECIES: hypothetical protein [Acidithiobacillus]MBU2740685.1 hypothetical protein [Acidithiobacillus albertensis]MBU2812164.1 hypothetical protein [Acidithiobacillus thiooxidans]MBU2836692.1 hypothetical protein [Acidithiobacillus thiooxidans]MDR7927250.1 hypothetical protein [Acidithiobacillus thiooxidans]
MKQPVPFLTLASFLLLMPVVAWAQPTTNTDSACNSSCKTTCTAEKHFQNQAKVDLALAQPPSPKSSFSEGCLSNLDSFHISGFSGFSISSALSSLLKSMEDEACSAITSTMNNEISQGNSILSFALDPKSLEKDALNSATSTVLNTEQSALDNASSTVSDKVGDYVSEAGTAESDASSDASNATSGYSDNWVNNLY